MIDKGFDLTPTIRNLAPHRHEETKHWKINDGIRILFQTKLKDALKSQFDSLF